MSYDGVTNNLWLVDRVGKYRVPLAHPPTRHQISRKCRVLPGDINKPRTYIAALMDLDVPSERTARLQRSLTCNKSRVATPQSLARARLCFDPRSGWNVYLAARAAGKQEGRLRLLLSLTASSGSRPGRDIRVMPECCLNARLVLMTDVSR